MMNDQSLPPAAVAENANALFALVSILQDPKAAKKLLGDLAAVASDADGRLKEIVQREAALVEREAASAAKISQNEKASAHAISVARDEHDEIIKQQRVDTANVLKSAQEKLASIERDRLEASKDRAEQKRRLRSMEGQAA